jgi:CRISPR-associated protein (TIGR03984 family)
MSEFTKPEDAPKNDSQVIGWLTQQLQEHEFLLAFADDGVIWGKLADGQLVTSHKIDGAISPELRGETLQQAFVFGKESEVRLFRDELGNWKALRVVDGDDVIIESQVLWGSRAHESKDGFTRVFDARQMGLDHIVPLEVENSRLDLDESGKECLRLEVHHLVEYSPETGEARIALSRLAGLSVGQRDLEVVK